MPSLMEKDMHYSVEESLGNSQNFDGINPKMILVIIIKLVYEK